MLSVLRGTPGLRNASRSGNGRPPSPPPGAAHGRTAEFPLPEGGTARRCARTHERNRPAGARQRDGVPAPTSGAQQPLPGLRFCGEKGRAPLTRPGPAATRPAAPNPIPSHPIPTRRGRRHSRAPQRPQSGGGPSRADRLRTAHRARRGGAEAGSAANPSEPPGDGRRWGGSVERGSVREPGPAVRRGDGRQCRALRRAHPFRGDGGAVCPLSGVAPVPRIATTIPIISRIWGILPPSGPRPGVRQGSDPQGWVTRCGAVPRVLGRVAKPSPPTAPHSPAQPCPPTALPLAFCAEKEITSSEAPFAGDPETPGIKIANSSAKALARSSY